LYHQVWNRVRDETYIQSYTNRLKQLMVLTKESGIDPVLITQPAVYGYAVDDVTGTDLSKIVIEGANGEIGEGLSGKEKWELLELYNNVTRKVARQEGILLIDLAQKMPKSTKYYYDYIHFTNDGAVLVADIIYSDLCPYLEKKHPGHVKKPCGEKDL
ncbi:hypothetical protein ACFL1A_00945, partial [Patescibacteria group bacterium]